MHPQPDGYGYVLSTGKAFKAFSGCIGIGQHGLTHGFADYIEFSNSTKFTRAERIEIAEYMITRWEAYKNDAESGKEDIV